MSKRDHSASLPLAPLSRTQVVDRGLTEVLTSPNKILCQMGGMGRGAQWPGEDTGYQHLALVGGMAGWHRVRPLRGLLLEPVTLHDESRRWEGDAKAGGGGARQQGSRRHDVMVTGLHPSKRGVVAVQTSHGPFGSPLPRRCMCRRGARLARDGGCSCVCCMHGQGCIA